MENELREEIRKLKKKIKELEEELKKYKKHNQRGAGRKPRFTDAEIEMIKLYRIQGMKIQEIANMYDCSLGLIHNILKECPGETKK